MHAVDRVVLRLVCESTGSDDSRGDARGEDGRITPKANDVSLPVGAGEGKVGV